MHKLNIEEFFQMPTEAEVKRNTLASWNAVEPVLLSKLHPAILRHTIPTRFVTIPTAEIIAHWLPAFDNAPAGEEAKRRLLDEGRAVLADFPDGFFFKLDSRSPKDTEIPRWTEENLRDLPVTFFNSERMLDDLATQRFHRDTFVLCFRQWVEMRDEQRVFVKEGQIQGITRYDYLQPLPIEYAAEHIDRVGFDAADYLADIAPHLPVADFVFDFGYRPNGEKILIELNPYGLSDPCCFGSYSKITGYAWQKE